MFSERVQHSRSCPLHSQLNSGGVRTVKRMLKMCSEKTPVEGTSPRDRNSCQLNHIETLAVFLPVFYNNSNGTREICVA